METKQIKLHDNQVNVNYLKSGNGELTILFLHGWCINAEYWSPQLDYFSKDYSVYALDLPGFGKSEAIRENWSIQQYAKDVLQFIDQLELKNIVLVGHSMSGAVMMEVVLQDSLNIIGLVGVDNFKFVDVQFTKEQIDQMSSFFPLLEQDFANNAPLYAENMLFHPSTPEEVKSRVKKDFASTNQDVGYGSFMKLMQYSQQESQKLERLPLKLNLINSDFPPTNSSGLENHCQNSFSIHLIENSGHYPMIEKSYEFNQKLDSILESITANVANN